MQTVQEIKAVLLAYGGKRSTYRTLSDQTGNIRAASIGMMQGITAISGIASDAEIVQRTIDTLKATDLALAEVRADYDAERIAAANKVAA